MPCHLIRVLSYDRLVSSRLAPFPLLALFLSPRYCPHPNPLPSPLPFPLEQRCCRLLGTIHPSPSNLFCIPFMTNVTQVYYLFFFIFLFGPCLTYSISVFSFLCFFFPFVSFLIRQRRVRFVFFFSFFLFVIAFTSER